MRVGRRDHDRGDSGHIVSRRAYISARFDLSSDVYRATRDYEVLQYRPGSPARAFVNRARTRARAKAAL